MFDGVVAAAVVVVVVGFVGFGLVAAGCLGALRAAWWAARGATGLGTPAARASSARW
ncbi:MAG: hypothetical protein JWQ48_2931, partial [Conexibacter sp.]|nr:hypothetical protein [Conexibacter sp.]